jgi:SAM-dependent methyltransferase
MRADVVELLACPRSGAPLTLAGLEADGDEVEAGLLHGPAGDFAVVAGIPVLRDGFDDIVELLRRGEVADATALAVVRGVSLSRIDPFIAPLLELRPTRAVARQLAARRDRSVARRATDALVASGSNPDPLLRLTHLDNRHPNVEGYRYFSNRLGLPRHLVALAAISAAVPDDRPLLEVGCGAGHLTWQLARLSGRRVLAVERELHLLWVAKRHLAPEADLVCGDALALPLRDGVCSLGVAVDVLSFVTNKVAMVRELRRVTGPEPAVALTSVINADVTHQFAGEPLPARAWRRLAGDGHVALADRTVLDAYLDGHTPPTASDDDGRLAESRTVTMLTGSAALAGLDRPLDGWPHAVGRLGVHPLLRLDERTGAEIVLRVESPSPAFARDNPDLERYLPDSVRLPRDAVVAARAGARPPALEPAIARAAVLGYPDAWPADPWAAVDGERRASAELSG